ncbi:unnamed protein product [Albugo candida]|uniref:Uncharacterized protein n=1 Tax=Albugo candida TaxID=65357 RepID=A0A024FY94_9STRA|nr:unnamed protein product [Albugo candida]|eukprot:CCI11639.1 unnamed protein product [Albugo candida]
MRIQTLFIEDFRFNDQELLRFLRSSEWRKQSFQLMLAITSLVCMSYYAFQKATRASSGWFDLVLNDIVGCGHGNCVVEVFCDLPIASTTVKIAFSFEIIAALCATGSKKLL